MSRYKNPAIRMLKDQQVKYAPRDVRLQQIVHAEQLLEEINPTDDYKYQDLCERITSFKPGMYPDLMVSGKDAVHDLRLFVEDVSDSADIPAEAVGEQVLTVEDLSRQYQVSTKTVDRWRNRGLVSRRLMFGNRKRVGFLQSSVERFVSKHAEDIQRGSKFSQLSDMEREEIVARARRLARVGGCPAEISRRLARRMGRAQETIRYTLKTHDQNHPDAAIFPSATPTMSDDVKDRIYQKFAEGVPAEQLAVDFKRTRASIYRVVGELRARRLMDQPIDFISSPDFEAADAAAKILGAAPHADRKAAFRAPPGLPPYLAELYDMPLLNREQEVYYFRKFNYLKFCAARLRNELDMSRAKARVMDEIEAHLKEAEAVKNVLIRSNLRLVVSVAKRHVKPNANFFEMVSDGNMSLIRAIEKFDYGRGNKFSTYATWAIMKNFARSIPAEHTYHDRYRTGADELFMASPDQRSDQFEQELVNHKQHEALMGILDQLEEREKNIILFRFGLNHETEPLTLEQLGSRFGVTKERIRQLEARALSKLRKIAVDEKLDIPGI